MKHAWEKSKAIVMLVWGQTSRRLRKAACAILLLGIAGMAVTYSSLQHVPVPRLRLEYGSPDDDDDDDGRVSAAAGSLTSSLPSSSSSSSFGPRDGGPYNASKLALLIEDRAAPNLAALLLHFMAVVPPDWRFRLMGSAESVAWANRSRAVRAQVHAGKLDLARIPAGASTGGPEMISRFLTSLWLYETALRPAEWLLVFQTDSVLCANARRTLDDFLGYDWVGAPWDPAGRFGGNGGLSLRRVSAIIEVLRDQVRVDGSEPEDVWLTERLGHRPGARMANGTLSLTFSGEMNAGQNVQAHRPGPPSSGSPFGSAFPSPATTIATTTTTVTPGKEKQETGEEEDDDDDYYIEGVDDWRDGFYEPMGYHTGGSGTMLHAAVWGTPELRRHIWDYCPEIKMTLAMDVARYVPGDCQANWKRDGKGPDRGSVGVDDLGYGSEIIDGVVYPFVPPNLVPW